MSNFTQKWKIIVLLGAEVATFDVICVFLVFSEDRFDSNPDKWTIDLVLGLAIDPHSRAASVVHHVLSSV